jgi:plasmid stability protein
MASTTIHNLGDKLKRCLRVSGADQDRSRVEGALDIDRHVVTEPAPSSLAAAIRSRLAPLGAVNLDPLPRESMRLPPRFSGNGA